MNNPKQQVHIIDKDYPITHSLSVLLQSVDAEIICHYSAENFLDRLAPPLPACLITEIELPGISGLELLKRLRSWHIHIPTILITTNSDIPTAVHSMRAGAIDFLEKPFIEHQLFSRIRQVLAERSTDI